MIEIEDIWPYHEAVNVYMNNLWGFTDDQVDGKPIKKDGHVIGLLYGADKDYLYGSLYDIGALYTDPRTFSIEIDSKE